jgi:flavin-dependent dehydrogenase
MEKHDTIIIGAGPGGLTAAKELAKKDRDVLVLEKNPERKIGDKICDGGFTPYQVERTHLPESVFVGTDLPLKFYMDDTEISPDLLGYETIAILDRLKLGQHQLREAKRFGAEVRDHSSVSDVNKKEKRVILRNGEEIRYDHLIAAFGSNATRLYRALGLRAYLTIGYQYLLPYYKCRDTEAWFDFDKIGAAYMWKKPHGDGKRNDILLFGDGYLADPGVNWDNQQRGKVRKKYFEKFFEERTGINFSKEDVIKRAWPVNVAWNGFKHGKDIYLVGDTGSYVNTMWGCGIYPAMKSGEAAAKAIIGIPYEKDLEEAKRHHQLANPGFFFLGLTEGKFNPKYAAKIWRWLDRGKYRHRFLSRTNNIIATKLLRKYPGWTSFLYASMLWAPTALDTLDTVRNFGEMYANARVPEE